jgi:tRNA-specific 2-thiouridylase
MSGGVDSSVAAALLLRRGFEVVGVMLRLWSEEALGKRDDLLDQRPGNRCCTLDAVNDARAVADVLGIPFYVLDAITPFYDAVVAPFIRAYGDGQTPNPCLYCNRSIRFGHLWRRAELLGADALATGHYARLRTTATGGSELLRGVDASKDQSYALSLVSGHVLARVIFPLGELTKPQVRELAADFSLPTASRQESQDLCFVADGDYRRFLQRHSPESLNPGPIVDSRGQVLGRHAGLAFFTIGQRGGLGIAATHPLYVLAKRPGGNTLVVGPAEELGANWLCTYPANWISAWSPGVTRTLQVQLRYRARPVEAQVSVNQDATAEVALSEFVRDVTPGQCAAFYDGPVCLGGGIIKESARHV